MDIRVCILLLLLFIDAHHATISCRDEGNKLVDWFVILKFPYSFDYVFLSANTDAGRWRTPQYKLNSNRNLLALTLDQLYDPHSKDAFFGLYNDDRPKVAWNMEKSHGGHLKGVIHFSGKSGYWLLHSVPQFPRKDKYDFTGAAYKSGQSFLCVSLDVRYLTPIVNQLLMMYSEVYGYNLPGNYSTDSDLMGTLYRFVINTHGPGQKANTINLTTLKDAKLVHFGKSESLVKDLYSDILSPRLNTSLLVETWMKGHGDKLHSSCLSANKVFNVRNVSIDGVQYSNTADHSKWALSASQTQPAVCIGDLDRMVDQMQRGGGALCIFEPTIWKAFFSIVKEYEPCPKLE